MTKTEAFQKSAISGVAIQHRFFSPDEWIIILPGGGKLISEDNVTFPIWEFMKDRQSPEWENDWSLYN